ncbi:hypothetical protein [Actinoplanes sp. NPDC026670]|uniref:hypothetical protein n=1 Tax=Actinoplanes sp. NPDC026670 TaxID=3154700 RepID=UPI00340CCCA0
MNERDLAEKLIRLTGENPPSGLVQQAVKHFGLNEERVFRLISLAKVKVTWDE